MIASILRNTLMITSFVLVMMLLIEYINVVSRGKWRRGFQGSRFKQVILTACLGIVPGCLGGFAVVSLFTHGIVNFGALVACMIATFGDEAFVLFAVAPDAAILLSLILFVVAVVVGLLVNAFVKKFPAPFVPEHFAIHPVDDAHTHANVIGNWRRNLRQISFQRAILITGILIVITAILMGYFEHAHTPDGHAHIHDHTSEHLHHGNDHYSNISGILLQERWLNIVFVAISAIALFIITVVHEHFLQEHLWGHIIKKHLPRIFLWTLTVLVILQLGEHFFDISSWVRGNHLYILLLAVAVGLIPESGPHIVFITLFAEGVIPFSILLTNSIVQEGHAGLPLLAESKRGFLWMKAISVAAGFAAGVLGYFAGF